MPCKKVKVDFIYVMPEYFEEYKNIFKLSDPSQLVGRIGDWKIKYSKRIDKTVYKSPFNSFNEDKPFTFNKDNASQQTTKKLSTSSLFSDLNGFRGCFQDTGIPQDDNICLLIDSIVHQMFKLPLFKPNTRKDGLSNFPLSQCLIRSIIY